GRFSVHLHQPSMRNTFRLAKPRLLNRRLREPNPKPDTRLKSFLREFRLGQGCSDYSLHGCFITAARSCRTESPPQCMGYIPPSHTNTGSMNFTPGFS